MHLDLLAGLRVVESSAFIAAPLAGMTMAQFGADVIRIDLPGGGIDYARLPVMPDGRSLYWTGLNKGKRSFAVDFRRPEGRELVQALVTDRAKGGGVLLTNIGSEWLSHDLLARRRPDVISCTIEGNQDGSTAIDYTVNSAAGFPAMTGHGSTDAPVNHVLPAWDIAAAYQAAFAVAAAASRRQATGKGAELRLSLADVAFSTLSHMGMLAEAELLDQERVSDGNFLYGAFGRDFATSDGRRVFVAGISSTQWRNLVAATGSAEALAGAQAASGLDFGKEADRYAGRRTIAGIISPWFAARTLEVVRTELDRSKVCWGPYQSVCEAVASDPRLSSANPIFDRIETKGVGRHLAAGATVRERGGATVPHTPAPLLGESTDAILADILGLGERAIGRLHDDGIVAGPDGDPMAGRRRSSVAS